MLPTPERYAEISQQRETSLKSAPFPIVLLAHASARKTACLAARSGQVQKKIILEQGVPVDCRSNLAPDTLSGFLVGSGRITEEQATAAFEDAKARGRLIGEVLVERRLLSPAELFRALQQNLATKLLDLFSWTDGSVELLDETPELVSSLYVKVPQLVYTGVTRMTPQAVVDRELVSWAMGRVSVRSDADLLLRELKLLRAHAALVDALRAPRRLADLTGVGELSEADVNRVVYALALLGIVAPEGTAPAVYTGPLRASAPGMRAALGPPGPLSEAPSSLTNIDALRDDVCKTYVDYRRLDAFELLGLTEDAGANQFEASYIDFARRFSPDRFDGLAASETRHQARELFLAGAIAYAQLMDPERRAALLARRRHAREEREGVRSARQLSVKADILDPVLHYKKGIALRDAGNARAAIQQFEFAARCDPKKGIYRAEAAYCRFLASAGADSTRAVEDLLEAQRLDPQCGLAFYYAGEISRHMKDWSRAETFLRGAAKLMAPDRRPLEALHAMVAERKR